MAKIDTSKIPGYGEMTAEEKLAALEGYNVPEPDYSGWVKKETFDKTAHEAADWKKKHNALLSDDEKKQQQRDEEMRGIQQELESLRKEKKIAGYRAGFAELGWDSEMASKTAEALFEGKMDDVLASMKKAQEDAISAYRAEAVRNTHRPAEGETAGKKSYKELAQKALESGNTQAYIYYTSKDAEEQRDSE